jgi:hypothetical protein
LTKKRLSLGLHLGLSKISRRTELEKQHSSFSIPERPQKFDEESTGSSKITQSQGMSPGDLGGEMNEITALDS